MECRVLPLLPLARLHALKIEAAVGLASGLKVEGSAREEGGAGWREGAGSVGKEGVAAAMDSPDPPPSAGGGIEKGGGAVDAAAGAKGGSEAGEGREAERAMVEGGGAGEMKVEPTSPPTGV